LNIGDDVDYLTERAGLDGKTAVVTGGAGGLGWPISRDLARAGVHVAVCDRDADAAAAAESELAGYPVQTYVEVADVRVPNAMAAFFDRVDERFGGVDILVDVPGGSFVAPLMDSRPKGWDAVIRQNFLYVLDTTQLAVNRMRQQGTGGSIIYITSIEAHRAVPDRAIYGAMKAGVTSLASSLAIELGPSNIRVNTVAPDVFPTPTAVPGWKPEDDQRPERLLSDRISIPLQRKGQGEDLSGTVLFLASDLASYVTGTTIHVDGGTSGSGGWFRWPDTGYQCIVPDEIARQLIDQDQY
jgi:NAD(P)-dependent dehydrogenase (short-subunit alcohol dehydrogenase family)